jgi:hypothetical protein
MHKHDSNQQPNVPIYLTGPCPSWCESWRHDVGADREDRFHERVKVELPASLADPLEIEPRDWIPNGWTIYLIQHVEAARPVDLARR